MIASFSITLFPVIASNEVQVGVKKGDWIEYNITITGPLLDSDEILLGLEMKFWIFKVTPLKQT